MPSVAVSTRRRTFAALIAAAMTSYLSIGVVIAVLPVYVKGPLGGSDVTVGSCSARSRSAMLLTRPLAGRLIDLRGPRDVIVVALAGGRAGRRSSTRWPAPAPS